jgi:hypothetical protein
LKKGITAVPVRGEVDRSVRSGEREGSFRMLAAVPAREAESAAQDVKKKRILSCEWWDGRYLCWRANGGSWMNISAGGSTAQRYSGAQAYSILPISKGSNIVSAMTETELAGGALQCNDTLISSVSCRRFSISGAAEDISMEVPEVFDLVGARRANQSY